MNVGSENLKSNANPKNIVYLHTEISIFFAFGFWIKICWEKKKIHQENKSMLFGRTFERRVISHQPVSLIWSFSLCQFFPPLQMYLDFRCPKEYCRLLFIPQCNVLDQKPTDRTMASVCVCVCICEGIVKDQIVSGNEYSSFFIIFTCVCVCLFLWHSVFCCLTTW